jgi:hypothetical protein
MASLAVNEARIQLILDRMAIEDCLVRYCHAIDRCDAELMRAVYWPEATDDHVHWKGNAEAFVAFAMPALKSTRDQTTHTLSNILIRVTANDARVQSHFIAYERMRRKDGTFNDVTIGGRYLDRMEKRNGEWRISERKVVFDWWRIWPDSYDGNRGLFGKKIEVGQRDGTDPSAALFGDSLMHPLTA